MRVENIQSSEEKSTVWRSSLQTAVRRAWPDAVAYREAIQHPLSALGDNDLHTASVSLDRMGMPLAYSGRFAVVFRLTTQPQGEKWALRCFTSPGEDGTGLARAQHYETIGTYTRRLSSIFVPFRYLDRGIRVGGEWFPAMTMRWAPGVPLGRWVENHLEDPDALRGLCGALTALLQRLEAEGIAHGDWQHDNLIVSPDAQHVTLVDYDGMYVPEFAGMDCPEMGHPNYQHPARTNAHFGPGLDRFPCLAIETALLALAQQPRLWKHFSDGESMLFKQVDFLDPEHSHLFRTIREIAVERNDELLAESMLRLQDACRAGAESTLLPAIVASDVPAPAFAPIAASATVQAPRSIPLTGAQWWQIPEATNASNATPAAIAPPIEATIASVPHASTSWYRHGNVAVAGGMVTRAGGAPRRVRSALPTTGTQFEYLAQLQRVETLTDENKHLWLWRGAALLLLSSVGGIGYAMHAYPELHIQWYYFLWLLNFAALGYGRWPRKRIYEELVREIVKMETLIVEREVRIQQLSGNAAGPVSPNETLAEFTDNYLRRMPIAQLNITQPGMVTTLRKLNESGIDNALMLKQNAQSSRLGQLPYEQLAVLERWYHDLETEAAAAYKKMTASMPAAPRPSAGEADRLRQEVAEFERHVAILKQERDQFPDVGFANYARLLFGLEHAATQPQVGPTP